MSSMSEAFEVFLKFSVAPCCIKNVTATTIGILTSLDPDTIQIPTKLFTMVNSPQPEVLGTEMKERRKLGLFDTGQSSG